MAYEDSIPLGRGSRSAPYQPPKKAPAKKKTPSKSSSSSGGYTIKKGDTLSAIARRNGTTVAKLAAVNNIKDVNKIQAGAKLSFTGGGSSSGARAGEAARSGAKRLVPVGR